MIEGKTYQYYQTMAAGQFLWQKIDNALNDIFKERKSPMRRSKLIGAIHEHVKARHNVANVDLFLMSVFEILEMMACRGNIKKTIKKGKAFIFKR